MTKIPRNHPRYLSLTVREKLCEHFNDGIVALQGLIAHGRGEAFDYILGEKTPPMTMDAIRSAAAAMLLAKRSVISVNGNAAALVAKDLVDLAAKSGSALEVNLFHRTEERAKKIAALLQREGAKEVLGVGKDASARIEELRSDRRRVDPRGILAADTVLVPLEDGDRTEALAKLGKKVIAIDLNPLSRTSRLASISVVDNIVNAVPLLTKEVERLKGLGRRELESIVQGFDNLEYLERILEFMAKRLGKIKMIEL